MYDRRERTGTSDLRHRRRSSMKKSRKCDAKLPGGVEGRIEDVNSRYTIHFRLNRCRIF